MSERSLVSRNILGFKSPIRRHDNIGDGGADGVVLTHAAGAYKSAEHDIAERDIPLGSISIKSTVEIV